jgi:hypothetical protein
MLALCAETDEVPWIGEAYDLAPAVSQDLVKSDRAGLDGENMRGRVAFSEHKLFGLNPTQRCLRKSLFELAQ